MQAEAQDRASNPPSEDVGAHWVNAISLGGGPPVILIHGMAASLCDWSSLAPELASSGYRAHALDLLGHGGSAKPDDPRLYHIEALYQHFTAWMEGLELTRPAILIGHSLGGYLSLLHALRRPPEVRALVLIDPYFEKRQLSPLLRLASKQPSLGEKAMRLTPRWMIHAVLGWNPDAATRFSPDVRHQIALDYKRASPHFVYITRDLPDLSTSLAQLAAPSLVIWGEQDLTLHPASFQRLVEALPHAHPSPISHAGHQPHITRTSQVNRTILSYLGSLP